MTNPLAIANRTPRRIPTACLAAYTVLTACGLAAPAQEPTIRVVEAPRYVTATLDVADAPETNPIEPAAFQEPDSSTAEPPPAPEEVAPQPEAPATNVARRFRPITEITVNAALPPGLLPEQVPPQEGQPAPDSARQVGDSRFYSGWGENAFEWSATKLCHGPLYFEQVNLERHGYQCHPLVQPFVSGAHFFLTVPTLPYQMTVHPPRECIYTLGYYRPGSRVPWRRHCLPWDARAAAVEAGVAVGLVFLIP
jgi:hypothetical protein